jgi:hypothetical protein
MISDLETKALNGIASQANEIEGDHLKHNGKNGVWTINGEEIDPRGVTVAVIMPLAVYGQLLFENKNFIDKDAGRLCDGFLMPKNFRPGWKPYVALPMVRIDPEHRGEYETYTACDFGAKKAFDNLSKQYSLRKGSHLPIINLGSRPRNDEYGTIDPTLTITGWAPRENFAMLLGEDSLLLEAPSTAPAAIAAPEDDEALARAKPSRRSGYAAEYNPQPADNDLPEMIDADPNDPDNY